MGNQLANGLVIRDAFLLESRIGEIAILVELGKSMLHHCVIQLQDDIEQVIVSMLPLSECLYPSVEGL